MHRCHGVSHHPSALVLETNSDEIRRGPLVWAFWFRFATQEPLHHPREKQRGVCQFSGLETRECTAFWKSWLTTSMTDMGDFTFLSRKKELAWANICRFINPSQLQEVTQRSGLVAHPAAPSLECRESWGRQLDKETSQALCIFSSFVDFFCIIKI